MNRKVITTENTFFSQSTGDYTIFTGQHPILQGRIGYLSGTLAANSSNTFSGTLTIKVPLPEINLQSYNYIKLDSVTAKLNFVCQDYNENIKYLDGLGNLGVRYNDNLPGGSSTSLFPSIETYILNTNGLNNLTKEQILSANIYIYIGLTATYQNLSETDFTFPVGPQTKNGVALPEITATWICGHKIIGEAVFLSTL